MGIFPGTNSSLQHLSTWGSSKMHIQVVPILISIALHGCLDEFKDIQRHGRKLAGVERANDVATAMAIDSSGNAIVTGYSKGPGSGYDYLTLKYDPNGNLLWSERLDGGTKGDDKPVAVQTDSEGNVYVTGASASKDNADYLTAKYSATGVLQWKERFNGAGNGFDTATGLAVTATGNVVVTGYSMGKNSGYDCVTVAYDSMGHELWNHVYNGPENEDDFATSIGTDNSGDVIVTGYSKTKRDGAGYLTIKYSALGKPLWIRQFAIGETHVAKATSLAVDPDGGVCVTGYAQGSHPTYDYVTVRYDANGKALWAKRLDGPGHGDDKPAAIVRTPDGDYIVTGESFGGDASGKDILTVRYSANGREEWQKRFDGSGLSDSASAMAIDPKTGFVVTGLSVGQDSGSDILTVKYQSDGEIGWSAKYNGQANDLDRPVAVGVNIESEVYVAGSSWGGSGSGFDYVLLKYSVEGKLIWERRYNGPGSFH